MGNASMLGPFAGTAIRRMAASAGKPKTGSGGLFETRLHGMTIAPWNHAVDVQSPGVMQSRASTTARWMLRGGKQNVSMAPWGLVGVVVGYFLIQDALPDSMRVG